MNGQESGCLVQAGTKEIVLMADEQLIGDEEGTQVQQQREDRREAQYQTHRSRPIGRKPGFMGCRLCLAESWPIGVM